jgi:predicted metal-binding membrane protein
MALNLEYFLKRDRWVVIGALTLVLVLAWAHLFSGAGMEMSAVAMTRMYGEQMDMPAIEWTSGYLLLMFWMWWIMMTAMMLPSVAPVLLTVAALNRNAQPDRLPYGPTGLFAAGYLVAWTGFSLLAVIAQWALSESGAVSEMMQATNGKLAGGLLIAAGLWQLTPIKRTCLRSCRAPAKFLAEHRRAGPYGGFMMGILHGVQCLGCCWLLMTLLFVGGVMNLYWIAGLAAFVLAEKLLAGEWFSRLAGAALVLWGFGVVSGLV